MTTDPAQLARALLRGEPEAFDIWYRAEHPAVWRLCFGFLARREEAEDVAQDALLRLYDHLGSWDQAQAYEPWRNTVVANLCRDRLRQSQGRQDAESGAAADLGLPDRLPAPDDRARAGEIRAALAKALGALSPREREVFVLRELEGQSVDTVAQSLAITASTVRSLCTLARRRMRDLLAPALPGLLNEGDSL